MHGATGEGVELRGNALPVRAAVVLGAGLLLGFLGDGLFRAPGPPALNFFLWVAALASAIILLQWHRGGTLTSEAEVLLGVGLLFAATLVWRDSPALKFLGLVAAAGAFALPAFKAGAAWVRRTGIVGYGIAVAAAGVHAGVGAVLTLNEASWSPTRQGSAHASRWRQAATIARGVAIALPLLLVFGGLFLAADPVFAEIVADLGRFDLERLASHVLLVTFFAWVATGYLRGFLTGTRLPELPVITRRRGLLGITEVAVVLGLLGLLFAAFLVVQFRYLFGGAALVEVTPGLTYAEYARRGFFELVLVSALMVPVLLTADWALQRTRPRDEWIFRTLMAVQILLLFAVMSSALQRMRLYQEAYGLTELRFFATALLLWLAVVLVWLTVTVLRGRRRSFAFGTLISAFVAAAVLQVMSPDAMIARTNISRALSGAAFDAEYTASLSGDAVPVLLARLPDLSPQARCHVARGLLDRWTSERQADWRSWNWSAARARAAVRGQQAELQSIVGTGSRCRAGP